MSHLDEDFRSALEHFQAHGGSFSEKDQYVFYGLQQQIQEGNCTSRAPDGADIAAQHKWGAWVYFKGLTQERGKQLYIKLLKQASPDFVLPGDKKDTDDSGKDKTPPPETPTRHVRRDADDHAGDKDIIAKAKQFEPSVGKLGKLSSQNQEFHLNPDARTDDRFLMKSPPLAAITKQEVSKSNQGIGGMMNRLRGSFSGAGKKPSSQEEVPRSKEKRKQKKIVRGIDDVNDPVATSNELGKITSRDDTFEVSAGPLGLSNGQTGPILQRSGSERDMDVLMDSKLEQERKRVAKNATRVAAEIGRQKFDDVERTATVGTAMRGGKTDPEEDQEQDTEQHSPNPNGSDEYDPQLLATQLEDYYGKHNPRLLQEKGVGHIVNWGMQKGITRLNKKLMKRYGADLTTMAIERLNTSNAAPAKPTNKVYAEKIPREDIVIETKQTPLTISPAPTARPFDEVIAAEKADKPQQSERPKMKSPELDTVPTQYQPKQEKIVPAGHRKVTPRNHPPKMEKPDRSRTPSPALISTQKGGPLPIPPRQRPGFSPYQNKNNPIVPATARTNKSQYNRAAGRPARDDNQEKDRKFKKRLVEFLLEYEPDRIDRCLYLMTKYRNENGLKRLNQKLNKLYGDSLADLEDEEDDFNDLDVFGEEKSNTSQYRVDREGSFVEMSNKDAEMLSLFLSKYEPKLLADQTLNKVIDWTSNNGMASLNRRLKKRYNEDLDDFIFATQKLKQEIVEFYALVDRAKLVKGLDKIITWAIVNGREELNRSLMQKYGYNLDSSTKELKRQALDFI